MFVFPHKQTARNLAVQTARNLAVQNARNLAVQNARNLAVQNARNLAVQTAFAQPHKIHTLGDSHSYNGWSGIVNHYLDSRLCYSFGRDQLQFCDLRNFDIVDGDTIIFCLGEIDCRCNIHKHIQTNSYETVINNIIEKYFEAIQLNITTSQLKLKTCVYNVPPPSQKHTTIENPERPYLGTDEERKKYTLYFNKKIKEKCVEYNYLFFDVYHHYTDEHGFLNKELSDGNVHIKDGKYITQFMVEHNL
jgi:hypothetical protein